MKAIPRSVIDEYTKKLNAVSAKGQAAIAKALKSYNYTSIEDLRLFTVELMAQLGYGCADAAASLSADFYDDIRESSVGKPLGAEAYVAFSAEAMEASVRYLLFKVIDDENTERFTKALQDKLDFTIKKASGDCVEYNVSRDPLKPKYARVPTGAETCEFCIMLASRGFVYNSANTAGAHYHANCDCRVVPGFDGINSKVEGYDPDALSDENYLEAQKAVEGRFTAKEWADLDNKDRTKLVLQEMRLQRKASSENWNIKQDSVPALVAVREAETWKDIAKSFDVDKDFILTKQYEKRVKTAVGIKDYSGVVKRAQSVLSTRSGTNLESLYAFRVEDGSLLASVLDSKTPRRAIPSENMKKAIRDEISHGNHVFLMHNHPGSSIPSADDIKSLALSSAEFGIIVCHDGSVFRYSISGPPLPGYEVSNLMLKMCYSTAIEKGELRALNEIERKLGVKIEHYA